MANTKAQESLLLFIAKNKRLPDEAEAVDLYTEGSLKNDGRCLLTINGNKALEYKYWELKGRAASWLRFSIGSLVLQGELGIFGNDK